MRGLWLVMRFMAWCRMSFRNCVLAAAHLTPGTEDKIITPGTHETHRKNIQPMNKTWYFYAFWLFSQIHWPAPDIDCAVSIVYGKTPCSDASVHVGKSGWHPHLSLFRLFNTLKCFWGMFCVRIVSSSLISLIHSIYILLRVFDPKITNQPYFPMVQCTVQGYNSKEKNKNPN